MKQSPQFEQAQARMRPGVIAQEGFLGDDRRPLAEIVDEDDAAVRRLGVTHAAIAARMRALRSAGAAGLGGPVAAPPHFEVTVDSFRGRLQCPFGDGATRKTNIAVLNLALKHEIIYTELAIHMIAAHGFYNGRGSPFRLAPADLAAILEVPSVAPAGEG